MPASVDCFSGRTDHDLDHIHDKDHIDRLSVVMIPMLCRICVVHIQSMKHVLDHSDNQIFTRQHDLFTIAHIDPESVCLETHRS